MGRRSTRRRRAARSAVRAAARTTPVAASARAVSPVPAVSPTSAVSLIPAASSTSIDPALDYRAIIPALPLTYVSRPRLNRQWDDWESHRLVTIEAPAGHGKTSAMAANVARSGRRVFWHTCGSFGKGADALMRHLLASVLGAQSVEPDPPPDPMLELPLLLDRIQSDPRGWNLVIDDLHHLGPRPRLLGFFEGLARDLPPGSTLFLASREPIPIRTGEMGMMRPAIAISGTILDFTPQETRELFRANAPEGLHPSDHDIDRITAKTEGWAACLAICLHHLIDSATSLHETLDRIDGAFAHATARACGVRTPDWFSYFAREVFASLDPALARFAMRAAVLPFLTPALCDDVLKDGDGRDLIKRLRARQLLIDDGPAAAAAPRRGRASTLYRFHAIFRDFLLLTLRHNASDREIAALTRRAALRLERDGRPCEAAECFVQAGDPSSALRILEREGSALLGEGNGPVLLGIFAGIEPAAYAERPRALHVLGLIHESRGESDAAEALYTQALRMDPPAGIVGDLHRVMVQMQLHRARYPDGVRLAREALRSHPGMDIVARARIEMNLGCCLCELGEIEEAKEHHSIAEEAAVASGRSNVLADAHYTFGITIPYCLGDWQGARDAIGRARSVYGLDRNLRAVCQCDAVLAIVEFEVGSERDARQLAESALRRAECFGLRAVEGLCHWTLGRCAHRRARALQRAEAVKVMKPMIDAESHLDIAERIGDETGNSDLRMLPRLECARIALEIDMRDSAAAWAAQSLERAIGYGSRQPEVLARTVVGMCGGDAAHPNAHWREAEALARRLDFRWDLHRLLLLRLHAGDVPEAEVPAVMKELLEGVTRDHHERLFRDHEIEVAVPVLCAALRRGIAARCASKLLVECGEAAVPELRRGLEDPDTGFRLTCAKLLGEIGGEEAVRALAAHRHPHTGAGRVAIVTCNEGWGSAPSLRIQTLRKLRIDVGERTVLMEHWRSLSALRVFLLLLLHDSRWVSNDKIIETFWPKKDARRAQISFRNAIHVLKKTLEPGLRGYEKSRFIIAQSNSVRLEPGPDSTYDVAQLKAGLTGSQTDLCKAIDLYQGDFVEELPFDDYLMNERDRLRDRWVQGVIRLLGIWSDAKRWKDVIELAKKGLAASTDCEDLHFRLINAYVQLRDSASATKAYRDYVTMRRDLGVLPSRRVRALIDQAG